MSYAICLGFRDWSVAHLGRCLASIRRARPGALVVVCDTGSRESTYLDVVALARVHGAELIPWPKSEWSRSVALNYAARTAALAHPTHLVFTDADMIFPLEWFDEAERAMRAAGDNIGVAGVSGGPHPAVLWITPSRDLPEHLPRYMEGPDSPTSGSMANAHDRWLFERSSPHPPTGQGGGMIVPAAWFERVGGFDEFYRGWGAEDNDLVLRAQWDGLAVQRLPAWVAHQWHTREAPPELWEKVQANRAYLAERVDEAGAGRPRVRRNDGR